MFITKKTLSEIQMKIKALDKSNTALCKEVKSLKSALEAQKKKNATYDNSIKNRQLHEKFEKEQADKRQKECNSIIDEWLNGAKDNEEEG